MALNQKSAKNKPKTPQEPKNDKIGGNEAELESFVIEKGIPIPTKSDRDSLVSKFPLKSMEVGDSFLVKKSHDRRLQNSISCSIRQYCKAQKMKHKFGVFKDPNSDFIRIWRKK